MSLSLLETSSVLTVVALDGRLDAAGVTEVQTQFIAETAGRKKPVIVNMEQVTFMASMGIRMLVEAAKSVKSSGGKLVLLKPQNLVEKSLKAAGLDVVVKIFHEEAEARAALVSST
jgi:anti-anti-sigma factor